MMQQMKPDLDKIRKRVAVSVAINGIVPLVVYFVLRQLIANDVVALAVAGVVPVARTIILWVWRRRLDWIGLFAVLSFAVALAVSVLSGGSPLAFELRGSVVTGLIGVTCLISVAVGQPLLIVLLKVFAKDSAESPSPISGIKAISRQRLTTITVVIGLALCGKTAADIILALALPTATYLTLSHFVNWAILGGGLLLLWWTRGQIINHIGENR